MEDSLETSHREKIYSTGTFNLHESVKCRHQIAIGINTCPRAGDSVHCSNLGDIMELN